jgi:acyl-CoA thioesterase-2
MTCSFKLPEAGDEHQAEMPVVENAETLQRAAAARGANFNPPPTTKGRVEMVLASAHFMQPEFIAGRAPELKAWMRCIDDRKLTEREAQTVLAFLSDGTLMFNSVIPHGLPFQTHRLTSIDHAAWFHRGCDVTQWMLFDQHSSAAADGRGMNHGTLFDGEGKLVMTAAQESMLRRTS